MSDEDAILIAQYGDDPELIMAIKASMQAQQEEELKTIQLPNEPPADADPSIVVVVQLRCPDGSKLHRRFFKDTTRVQDLINFYRHEKKVPLQQHVSLSTNFPKKTLDNFDMTLAELKFGKQESLIVS